MTQPAEIVVPICLQHTRQATTTSPWFVQRTEYPPRIASYVPLINGEAAFKAVYEAIARAEHSIDIICWGFQPSMYFIRDPSHPGSETCIGQLLLDKAKAGVRVRVLGWEAPLNSAGLAGEANLPGKSHGLSERAGQTASDEQHAFDHHWFKTCAVAGSEAAKRGEARLPRFVSRGFSAKERGAIDRDLGANALDPELSGKNLELLKWTPTHHQKSVLVDFERTDKAVGFVMGHNMLDEYWDTDAHSALRRGADMPAPNRGPRGARPRQDISCRIRGPLLEHLHLNFATAWQKETGEDLVATRRAAQIADQLQCGSDGTRLMAQLLRTQAQEGKHDIQTLYLQAVNNATQLIYIENQYFRWPPLAEAIKRIAAAQAAGGCDPGKHGALYLFVVTNASDDAMGTSTVNTQRMLESLGRADAIPRVTKLRRIERMKQGMPPKPRPDGGRDWHGQRELAAWQAEYDRQVKAIEDETLAPEDIPGLKTVICTLVAKDSPPGQPWMPVYIHSKVMTVNDVFTTHGSANINTRSMQVDSELNLAHDWMAVTQKLRRDLFHLHTDGKGAQDEPKQAFDAWQKIVQENKRRQEIPGEMQSPDAPIVGFLYDKAILSNLD